MMDVDSFKLVNDSYGHEAGDKLLCTLADLLVFELRTSDWIGRLGGEEFAIVFPETNFDGAKLACERLLQQIREAKLDLDGTTIGFTVSIGLATANSDSNDPDALMKTADKLMYKAKAAGKNNIQVEFQRERHDYQLNQKESVVSLTGTNVG
jgi:diguanylate cyclase (GGDEF)-like protein